jgi:hypothetical protein
MIQTAVSEVLRPGDMRLPACCLCLVQRGSAGLRSSGSKELQDIDRNTGVIYQGRVGTSFASSDDNKRLAVWIPLAKLLAKLRDCFEDLVERPITGDLSCTPAIGTTTGVGASLRGLLGHLEQELSRPESRSAALSFPGPGGPIASMRRANKIT